MPNFLPVILAFFITTILEGLLFYWLFKRDQSKYNKEKNSFTAARKVNSLLLQSSDSTSVLQKLADFLPNELNFATGVLVLYEKDTKTLRRVAASNTREATEAIKALSIPFTKIAIPADDPQNLMSRAIREKKDFVTNNLYDVFVPVLSQKESAKIQQIMATLSTIIYPIYVADTPLGVFIASSKKEAKEITDYEKEIISIFVDGAGIALQNSLFIDSIQKTTDSLKKANIQIGLTGKLKEDLLAMASHEFRTPISNIKSMLWMLQKQDFSAKLNDNEKQKFDRLTKAVERLDYVVRNINEMLRATSGNLEEQLHFDAVQIEQIIKEIIEDKEIEAKEALVNLVYQEPQNLLPSLEADPVKLQYCLYELITNALKYTDKNGTVTITTELQENSVVIKISDTGKGIPPEHIPTLFQGFDKIDVIHTSQAGMGLGLYIVAKIIKLHKGKINVESTAGKGTTFTIELPVQKTLNNNDSHSVHEPANVGI